MRKINQIVLHCSATPPDMDIGVEEIRAWHLANGWNDCGYHYVIRLDGKVEKGRHIQTPGAHAKGYNRNSIGICLVGGLDCNNKPTDKCYTRTQMKMARQLIDFLTVTFPMSEVCGHNNLTERKTCPNFNVINWYY